MGGSMLGGGMLGGGMFSDVIWCTDAAPPSIPGIRTSGGTFGVSILEDGMPKDAMLGGV